METTIYSNKGIASGSLKLPEAIFDLPWNGDLVHQVAVAIQANMRDSIAHAKDRSQVSGGGKKPWAQKGTGRARHGSTRSPIWRHGGVTHGPLSEKDYSQKINRKMRTKALFTVLSQKMRDGEIMFVDNFALENIKTKEAAKVLLDLSKIKGFERLASKRKNTALISVKGRNEIVEKSFSNIPSVMVDKVEDMSVVDALSARYLIITAPEEAIKFFESKK
ncbi:50S ribosomal protein L4 [Candidatus Nomurabacteria bacterium RIFCSPHIGHO2_02_FULL_38_15]|uniref:Large ribosomal subunit protein uL4 n=1 Tax=Candidatus Nomurabacteria bacterium RIFCSPHIGHO2_02_FULL_38_15 TaxID=1801752 RepID=A0A1F6VS96_9BACT|nr:MAG: 50S ribosomal protein L4 [Candidatus Nomurabacteria bacterium RIFCSPHIGHO2_02_FULL_38_15]